jgi:F-type H+-transporting ATPase subunit gamma
MALPMLVSRSHAHVSFFELDVSPEVFKHTPPEGGARKQLFVVISSDKGLCGSIHSSVTKATRRALAEGDPEAPVMVIGDKSKSQFSRSSSKNLKLTFNQIGRDIPTFADAAGVADLIVKSGVQYDSVVVVYNKYISQLSFEATTVEVLNYNALKEAREFISF